MTSEKKEITGYAKIIGEVLLPLNSNDVFQRRYEHVRKRYILNSPYWSAAVMIVIKDGRLMIERVGKDPKENLAQMVRAVDGYVEMSTYDFLAFAMKRLTMMRLLARWLTCSVKIRKPFKLITLYRIYRLIDSS